MPTPKPKNRAVLNKESLETKVQSREPESPRPSSLVTVRVKRQPVNEGGVHYSAGDAFDTTPARAAALADLCDIVAPE